MTFRLLFALLLCTFCNTLLSGQTFHHNTLSPPSPCGIQPRRMTQLLPYFENDRQPNLHSTPDLRPRTSWLSFVTIAEGYNAYSFLRSEQNFLYANNSLQFCGIIHQMNYLIWGGPASSGYLGYNCSTDGGFNWNEYSLDTLNPIYTRKARYPQFTAYLPPSATGPTDGKWVWAAPTIDSPAEHFDGHANGICPILTTPLPLTGSEHYAFQGEDSYLPNGLCPGLPGEFWMTEMQMQSDSLTGAFYLLKGTWDTGTSDVNWVRADTFYPNYDLSFDGKPHFSEATIEFSPDGSTGWISLLGDVAGGPDSLFSPLLWRSADGGATWTGPTEVDLSTIGWIKDSLQSLWVDSSGMPAGSGIPSTGFDHDITVDMNGNVHMGVVLLNASLRGQRPDYTVQDDLAKMMVDLYTPDGGATWEVKYLYPVLTFRGEFGGASGSTPLVMDNHPKCARNEAGDHLFFQWTDSDTNFVGFGESANQAPDLLITSWRLSDGYITCVKDITGGDILWGSQILFPNVAPVTLKRGGAEHLLNGFLSFRIVNDEQQVTDFNTLINDSYFGEADYFNPTLYDRYWHAPCISICTSTDVGNLIGDCTLSPNPAQDLCEIRFELTKSDLIQISLQDLAGRTLLRTSPAALEAGEQRLSLSLEGLASGMYTVTLRGNTTHSTQKLVIQH